jgi:DUF4097 and DUF4098 domain-containing protein YvlB
LKYTLKFAATGVAAFVLTASALAQEGRIYREGGDWVQEITASLNGAKNLRVKLDTGSVQVQGGSQSGITYVIHRHAYTGSEAGARREFESNRVNATIKGDTAWIVAEGGGGHRKCSDNVTITVPRGLDLAKVETGGGNVAATGISGRIELESGGGNLRIDDIGGSVKASTGGGTIEVGNAGADVSLETGGGNIKINSAKGEIKAETGGGTVTVVSAQQGATLETGAGSIRLERCSGRVKASTGGGSIDLGQVDGAVKVDSGAGSIRVGAARGRVEAETGGGSIELNGATSVRAETAAGGIVVKLLSSQDARNDSSIETATGDITVYLANDVPVTIRASVEVASGHGIRSDFGDIHISSEGGNWGPRTVTAEGRLNGGGPVLKVRTTSGNISFLRASR